MQAESPLGPSLLPAPAEDSVSGDAPLEDALLLALGSPAGSLEMLDSAKDREDMMLLEEAVGKARGQEELATSTPGTPPAAEPASTASAATAAGIAVPPATTFSLPVEPTRLQPECRLGKHLLFSGARGAWYFGGRVLSRGCGRRADRLQAGSVWTD